MLSFGTCPPPNWEWLRPEKETVSQRLVPPALPCETGPKLQIPYVRLSAPLALTSSPWVIPAVRPLLPKAPLSTSRLPHAILPRLPHPTLLLGLPQPLSVTHRESKEAQEGHLAWDLRLPGPHGVLLLA